MGYTKREHECSNCGTREIIKRQGEDMKEEGREERNEKGEEEKRMEEREERNEEEKEERRLEAKAFMKIAGDLSYLFRRMIKP